MTQPSEGATMHPAKYLTHFACLKPKVSTRSDQMMAQVFGGIL
jgi:hypothetical protein